MSVLEAPEVSPFTHCPPQGLLEAGPRPTETPTEDALSTLLAEGSIRDPDRQTIAVVDTDGRATCDATADSHAALGAALVAAGIRVAIVGFSITDVAEAGELLEALGRSGSLAPPGGRPYYLANDGPALDAACAEITEGVISRTLVLDGVPPDADDLHVFLGATEVPRGGADGWGYDADDNAVVLRGAACDLLTSGSVTTASVV